jgi:hypothetical protein
MKTVTVEEFLKFDPCYSGEEIRKIAGDKREWTALDVLALEDVPPKDRLWAVLREEFIPARTLHEFACAVAEEALAGVEHPDPRASAGPAAKRKGLHGEISDAELRSAHLDAWNAAAEAASAAALAAARGATAAENVAWAARAAAGDAAERDARDTADAVTADAVWQTASAAARERQIEILIRLLRESEKMEV